MRLPHRHVLSGQCCDGTDARSTPERSDPPRHPSAFLPVQQVGAASHGLTARLRWEMPRDARGVHAGSVHAPSTQAAVPPGQIIWALNSLAGFRPGAGCGCGLWDSTGSLTPCRVAKSDSRAKRRIINREDARCLVFDGSPNRHAACDHPRAMAMGCVTFGCHPSFHPRLAITLQPSCCCELNATG
jgi:hypothetical protein